MKEGGNRWVGVENIPYTFKASLRSGSFSLLEVWRDEINPSLNPPVNKDILVTSCDSDDVSFLFEKKKVRIGRTA